MAIEKPGDASNDGIDLIIRGILDKMKVDQDRACEYLVRQATLLDLLARANREGDHTFVRDKLFDYFNGGLECAMPKAS